MGNRRAVIVMGMHRSGTSAMTRVLNLLGLQLNNKILPPQKDNPAGFWESNEVIEINAEIMIRFNSSWDDFLPLANGWDSSDKIVDLYTKAESVLTDDFDGSPYYLLKDPRLCKLMPFWRRTLIKLGFDIYYVCVTRNPLEVMSSQATRDKTSPLKSSLLWLTHVITSEYHTRDAQRIFVTYQQLISDWRQVINRISKQFEIQFPIDPDIAAPEIAKFLNCDMRHHIKSAKDLDNNPYCQGEIQQWHEALLAASNDDLQPILQLANLNKPIIRGPLLRGLRLLEQQLDQTTQQLTRVTNENNQRAQTITDLYASHSWRLTKFLRQLRKPF